MRPLTLLLILGLSFTVFEACKEDRGAVKSLEQETMRLHDEAMKGMADLNRVSRSLKQRLETLDSLAPQRIAIKDALLKIERADADMNNWMVQYQSPTHLKAAEAQIYLNGEKTKIEKNWQDIKAAIATGEALLR